MSPVASGNFVLLGKLFNFWHIGSVSFFSVFFPDCFSDLQRVRERPWIVMSACCNTTSVQLRDSLTNSVDFFFLSFFFATSSAQGFWLMLKIAIFSQGYAFSHFPWFLWFFLKVIVPRHGCIQAMWVISWILRQECGLNGTVSRGWLPCCCCEWEDDWELSNNGQVNSVQFLVCIHLYMCLSQVFSNAACPH